MGSGSLGVLFSLQKFAGSGLVSGSAKEVSAWVSAGGEGAVSPGGSLTMLADFSSWWGLAEWEGWRLEFSVRTLARGQQQDGRG